MDADIVTDYLGRPCKVAQALQIHWQNMGDAREAASKEPRETARRVAAGAIELGKRLQTMNNMLDACLDVLPESTDDDKARSVLDASRIFCMHIRATLTELPAWALLALEQGGLRALKTSEASHG